MLICGMFKIDSIFTLSEFVVHGLAVVLSCGFMIIDLIILSFLLICQVILTKLRKRVEELSSKQAANDKDYTGRMTTFENMMKQKTLKKHQKELRFA